MALFGLIAEGNSDLAVLENILIGLFEEDISDEIETLQPDRGATYEHSAKAHGGWYKVFEYCRSDDFEGAFDRIKYLVVQIDTDVSEEKHYDIKKTDDNGRKLLPEEIVERVKDKFLLIIENAFGQEFLTNYRDRIIFAISVDEIECWLLPLFYSNNTKGLTRNCDFNLHQKAGKFAKKYNDYDKVSEKYRDFKTMKKSYPMNPSLKIFVESILAKNITT